ncbi:hypothetical protein MRBBS_0818 [Marinobacter sp. BSs20148]|nr:hypothetical protein MRBBS_0818 [Marinobacter sp. BSs20148]
MWNWASHSRINDYSTLLDAGQDAAWLIASTSALAERMVDSSSDRS